MSIEAKGEEAEEVNVNLYEMVKKCVIGGGKLAETVNKLLDLGANLLVSRELENRKARANSMI